ncbi:MAG: peptidylprolyl isomerase [Armatimonadota bacterium]|nr:peptidylprolyl isomerase [Armatimonadota bacterium]
MVAHLAEDDAPLTTANFIELAQKGFYDGLTFHRYAPGFVIQGGDPSGNGTGGSGKTVKGEFESNGVSNPGRHDAAGVLAMARSGDPNSASSQFYFTLAAAPHLDKGYAVFGKVISGLDAVQALREGDRMNTVTIS